MGDRHSPTRRFYQLVALVYLVCLSWMLLAPDPWIVFGEDGERLAEQASRTLADYFQHAGAFVLLAILAHLALHLRDRDQFRLRASLLVSYALLTEMAQFWIPDRQFQWFDLLANLLGILAGFLLANLLGSTPAGPHK